MFTAWVQIPKDLHREGQFIILKEADVEQMENREKAPRISDIISPFISPLPKGFEPFTQPRWILVKDMQDTYYRATDLIVGKSPYKTNVDYQALLEMGIHSLAELSVEDPHLLRRSWLRVMSSPINVRFAIQ